MYSKTKATAWFLRGIFHFESTGFFSLYEIVKPEMFKQTIFPIILVTLFIEFLVSLKKDKFDKLILGW